MSRRYLTIEEAESSLKRGKEIEAFLGGFEHTGKSCIRWVSIATCGDKFVGKVWESFDEGSNDYLDIYSFTPLNEEWDEPAKSYFITGLNELIQELAFSELKFVNSGVVQDEYRDFKSKKHITS